MSYLITFSQKSHTLIETIKRFQLLRFLCQFYYQYFVAKIYNTLSNSKILQFSQKIVIRYYEKLV